MYTQIIPIELITISLTKIGSMLKMLSFKNKNSTIIVILAVNINFGFGLLDQRNT